MSHHETAVLPSNVIQLAAGPPCPECGRRILHLADCMTGFVQAEARILEEAAEIAALRRPALAAELLELAAAKRGQVPAAVMQEELPFGAGTADT